MLNSALHSAATQTNRSASSEGGLNSAVGDD